MINFTLISLYNYPLQEIPFTYTGSKYLPIYQAYADWGLNCLQT